MPAVSDAHTAMLLGAAKVLKEESKKFLGTVKPLFFQSAERNRVRGRPFYIKNGILKDVDAAFAIHVQPGLPLGTISLDAGLRSTSCTNFNLTIMELRLMDQRSSRSRCNRGRKRSDHGYPNPGESDHDPLNPLVATIGKVEAGKQFNIICDEVKLEGTIRTYDRDLLKGFPKSWKPWHKVRRKPWTAMQRWTLSPTNLLCSNDDPALLDAASKAAVSLWGEEALVTMPAMMACQKTLLLSWMKFPA